MFSYTSNLHTGQTLYSSNDANVHEWKMQQKVKVKKLKFSESWPNCWFSCPHRPSWHFCSSVFHSSCTLKKSDFAPVALYKKKSNRRECCLKSKERGAIHYLWKSDLSFFKSDLLQICSFHHAFPLLIPKTKEWMALKDDFHSHRSLKKSGESNLNFEKSEKHFH